MRRIFVLLCLAIGGCLVLGACQKEETQKEKEEEQLEEVFIWEPGPQTYGFAKGKKNRVDFEATAVAIYHNAPIEDKVYIKIGTYSESGFGREDFHLGNGVPLQAGKYELRTPNIEFDPYDDIISINYGTLIDGGDVAGDSYTLDETKKDNMVELIEVDTLNEIIKGEFTATFFFNNQFPKTDPRNPDVVKFSEVYFEVQIIE